MEQNDRKKVVESLLFVSKRPVSVEELSDVTGFPGESVDNAIREISSEYETRGLQVIRLANGFIVATRPQYSEFVEKFLNSPVSVTLSQQALEALSIIAYKQPVAKGELEAIRGVMCDGVIATLLDRKLIKESGRADTVGRPILYSTTVEFLKHFGLHDLGELPVMADDESSRTALFGFEGSSEQLQ